MSSIAGQYDKTVDIQRMVAESAPNADREAWGTVITDVPCHIQPLSAEQIALMEGVFFQSFKMWCDNTHNIKEGDRVKDGSDYYTVDGVQNFTEGNNPHLEIVLQKGNE